MLRLVIARIARRVNLLWLLLIVCAIIIACTLRMLMVYLALSRLPTPPINLATIDSVSVIGPSVTPVVHQSWKTRKLPSKRTERWSGSWRSCLPNWSWRLWTDDDNLALIKSHYAWFLPVYLGYTEPILRADVARYFYMHRYGGIYADLDTLCVRNFTHLLDSASISFSGMDYTPTRSFETIKGTYVQNSFMASRPGHPFWMRLAVRAWRAFYGLRAQGNASEPVRAEYLTGPLLLLEELRDYTGNDINILPARGFNPFSWSVNQNPACKDLGGMTDEDEQKCVASFPEAYVVQFHTQSWLKGHM